MSDQDAELRAAYDMIENLMGRLYADAPFDGDPTTLAAWVWDRLHTTDGKICPNCGACGDAGAPFVIGPNGSTWCPDCAGHIGYGCPSDPMF